MADAAEARERLTRIRIEGFKSIAYADVELREVNVFIGANGAGKSNLIGFLQLVRAIMWGNLPRFVDEQRGANALLHFGIEKTPKIVGALRFQREGLLFEYAFALFPASGDRLLIDGEEFRDLSEDPAFHKIVAPERGQSRSWITSRDFVPPEGPMRNMDAAIQQGLANVRVYHLNNSTSTSLMRGYQPTRENVLLLGHGENTAVMLLRIRNEYPANYNRIRDEMRSILPEFQDFVLEPDPFRGKEQIELRWRSRNSEYTMGPEGLSDGSIRAVSLLTLLLQPDEWKPSILVIDEPELGLHPYAVGRIGRLIAEAGTTRQVIVSTQSPGMVAQFEPEDVVVVESERGASTFRRLDRESLGPWLEAYDGDLGRLFEMNVTGGAPE